MRGRLPGGLPHVSTGAVDVRDVAEAHLKCLELDEAQGKRFILANKVVWF